MGNFQDSMREGLKRGLAQAVRLSASAFRWIYGSSKVAISKLFSLAVGHKVLAASTVIVLTGTGYTALDRAIRDSQQVCQKNVAEVMSSLTDSELFDQTDEGVRTRARRIHSVLKSAGFSNEVIAGIVGNFAHESAIQSYRVEGIAIGDVASMEEAMANPDAYVTNKLHGGSGYVASDGKKYMGIGLGQWTAGRHVGLVDFAKSQNKPWYDIDVQMEYMVTADSGAGTLEEMKKKNFDTPEKAADFFLEQWERPKNPGATRQAREKSARSWFIDFQDASANGLSDYGGTVFTSAISQKQDDVISTAQKMVQSSGCSQECTSAATGGKWTNPTVGTVTSEYDMHRLHPIEHVIQPHTGTDIGAASGTPVRAANSGEVIAVGKDKGAGNYVAILHEDGVATNYLHLLDDSTRVKKGDKVFAGQEIASVGSTGSSTAAHLHFEVRLNVKKGDNIFSAEHTDPKPYMKQHGVQLGEDKDSGTGGTSLATSTTLCSGVAGTEREQIVEFARSYLGNPYYWGGKSSDPKNVVVEPNEWKTSKYKDYTPHGDIHIGPGMDCSGYTKFVYGHFGYDIGDGTVGQEAKLKSRQIDSIDKAEPGDIILWDGHVAIYIGNGKIYHASSSSTSATIEGKKVYDTIESNLSDTHRGESYRIYQVVGMPKSEKK